MPLLHNEDSVYNKNSNENGEIKEGSDEERCVLLVCGLPGAGKTTLCHLLQEMLGSMNFTTSLLCFDDFEVDRSLWDAQSFEISRVKALQALDEQLLREGKESRRGIVIVDDVMFFRSMRRKVYQLARDRRFAYLPLFVDIPLAVARNRNATRPAATKVKEQVM